MDNGDFSPQVSKPSLLSILIPVYNERAYLKRCVTNVLAVSLPNPLQKEIIIVDDGSSDGTADIVNSLVAEYSPMIRAFFQKSNEGKGAAMRRGIAEMRGDYVIFQDADLEYDPNDYDLLLQPLLLGHADVVYGSRFAVRNMRRVFNYHHALGNKFLTHLSNMTTGLDLTDMETGYKAFRSDVLKTIPIRAHRFGIEPEITAKIAKRGCRVYEVPISYRGRSYAEGKKIGWKDGLAALYFIIKYWLIDDCYSEQYALSILQNLSHARKFNRWMIQVVQPFLGDRIIEVGAGIGSISRHLPKREKLVVTDIDPIHLELLYNIFRDDDRVQVAKLDIRHREDCEAFGALGFDTVLCSNVLEHVDDDVAALDNLKHLLKPGGRLIVLVPQYKRLFGSYDEAAGHIRRYNADELTQKLRQMNLRVVWSRNFNSLAIPAWWLNSRFLRKKNMSRLHLKVYDTLVPLLAVLERLFPLPGLSLMCVAELQTNQ